MSNFKQLKMKFDSTNQWRFNFFWHGKPLSWIEKLVLKTWSSRGENIRLFCYDPELVSTVSDVEIVDASLIIPRSQVFRNSDRDTFAGFSNIFRYILIQNPRDVWVDFDMLRGKANFVDPQYLYAWENDAYINGAILGSGNPELGKLLHKAALAKLANGNVAWGELGPKLITEQLLAHGLSVHALPKETFYGLPVEKTWQIFDRNYSQKWLNVLDRSPALHIWNEVIRMSVINIREFRPPTGSLLDLLCQENSIELQNLPELPARWVRTYWRRVLEPPLFAKKLFHSLPLEAQRVIAKTLGR